MKNAILSFQLTMPNCGSWNGNWSGQDKKYYFHRIVSGAVGEKLLDGKPTKSWYYNFGDGWGANVSVEIIDSKVKKAREKVSAGFCGYEWMVREILDYGKILSLKEREICNG